MEEESLFNAQCWGIGYQQATQHLTSFTKINSKWIVDLNIKHKAINLLEDEIGGNLWDQGFCEDFFFLFFFLGHAMSL